MIEDSKTVRCKHFNTGYCKFGDDQCNYKHPKVVCMLKLCQDKSCPKRHPKACRFKAHCRRRSSCQYRHSKYESLNVEEEIDKLKEEIKQLQWFNTEKMNQLMEMEEIKTENLNLKQKLKETEVNLAVKREELVKVSNQVELLETKLHDDSAFEQKAIAIFKYACFKEDNEADIKMYILVNYDQHVEFLWDENVKCPDCNNEFEDIANIRKHFKKHNFKCHMCGKCLKERESCNHVCGPEHVFKKTPLEERRPISQLPQQSSQ